MATERTNLKQKLSTLKRGLGKDFDEFIEAKSSSPWSALAIIRKIEQLVSLQAQINATYKTLDERVMLERVAKRRKLAAGKGAK